MARPSILRGLFDSSGSVAIEYAVVGPVMLLFTLGIMDISRLLWIDITLTEATEAAARCGAVNTTACPSANIAGYAAGLAWGVPNITSANFTPTTPSCGVQVVGTYTYTFIVPWFPQFSSSAPFGSASMTLTATACYPKS